MKWKLERWLTDIFPGQDKVYEAYRHFSGRELVIVAASVVDLALVDLISRRCADKPEVHDFLGVDENGRAPAGSFGARIQLALILDIITEEDVLIIRALKDLRNKMAHRVKVDWFSKDIQSSLDKLLSAWECLVVKVFPGTTKDGIRILRIGIKTRPLACEALIHTVLSCYQAYFHLISNSLIPLGPAIDHGKSMRDILSERARQVSEEK